MFLTDQSYVENDSNETRTRELLRKLQKLAYAKGKADPWHRENAAEELRNELSRPGAHPVVRAFAKGELSK